jgi:aryl-alcohol dehydrogenase-like predicted oxidoreductase
VRLRRRRVAGAARADQPARVTRDNILRGVEQSLARMRTDHLDVLQFHASPSRATLERDGGLDAVLELKRAGTTRFVGMSGTLPHLADHVAMGVFDVFQIPYSAVEREHEATIAAAAQGGAGVVIRGGAAKGAPTEGKREGVQWERWRKVDLRDLTGDMTPMEFILRFTFTHPDMHTNIVGTVNPAHLQHNVEVLRQGPLPADVYAEAKRRLDAAGSTPRPA